MSPENVIAIAAQVRDSGTFALVLWLSFHLHAHIKAHESHPDRLSRIERRLGIDPEQPTNPESRILRVPR